MRKELIPDILIAVKKKEIVTHLFSKIERSLDQNDESLAIKYLAELNNYVDKSYGLNYFREYWGWIDKEDLIMIISTPKPKRIKIKKEEIEEIIERIADLDHSDYYLELLCINFSHPAISNLIYHSAPELSNKEIAEIIFNYKPIQLS